MLAYHANAVINSMARGTVEGFITYIEVTNPSYSKDQIASKLQEMLTLINWSKDSIDYWTNEYFIDV